jgi:hypothetical protein
MHGFVDLSWKVMWETCRKDLSAAAGFDSGCLESSTAVMSDRRSNRSSTELDVNTKCRDPNRK